LREAFDDYRHRELEDLKYGYKKKLVEKESGYDYLGGGFVDYNCVRT